VAPIVVAAAHVFLGFFSFRRLRGRAFFGFFFLDFGELGGGFFGVFFDFDGGRTRCANVRVVLAAIVKLWAMAVALAAAVRLEAPSAAVEGASLVVTMFTMFTMFKWPAVMAVWLAVMFKWLALIHEVLATVVVSAAREVALAGLVLAVAAAAAVLRTAPPRGEAHAERALQLRGSAAPSSALRPLAE
jgi:hypothetical protein